jgi:Protein of unknown function (DUF3592)
MDRAGDWIGTAIGLFCTGLCGHSLWRGLRALRWPASTGRVLEVTVYRSRHGGLSSGRYEPRVRYEYEVAGHRYIGDRLTFGLIALRSSVHAAEKLFRQKPGDAVRVRYDPRRPDRAVLRPGTTFMTFWVLSIGLVFLITSLASLGAALRAVR